MKLFSFIFLFLFSFSYSQKLDENNDIDVFLKSKMNLDDVYEEDIRIRIKYINDFNKIILVNYVLLPDSLTKKLDKDELEVIKSIYAIYSNQLKKMENEFEYNQKVTFKSLTPKSRINNLLLIDELKNFPDSYSLISNLNFDNFNSKELKDNMNLIVNIFEKNKELLEGILLDVNRYKILFKGKPLYYPEWETENIISYYEKINVVLWCYSNSKFFKHNY